MAHRQPDSDLAANVWGYENVRLSDDRESEVRQRLADPNSGLDREQVFEAMDFYEAFPFQDVPSEIWINIQSHHRHLMGLHDTDSESDGDEDDDYPDEEGNSDDEEALNSPRIVRGFPGFHPPTPTSPVDSISSRDSKSDLRPKHDFWPTIEAYIQNPAGTVPIVDCTFCNYRLVVPGLQEQNGQREAMRKLDCGHVIGDVCYQAFIEEGNFDDDHCPIGRCHEPRNVSDPDLVLGGAIEEHQIMRRRIEARAFAEAMRDRVFREMDRSAAQRLGDRGTDHGYTFSTEPQPPASPFGIVDHPEAATDISTSNRSQERRTRNLVEELYDQPVTEWTNVEDNNTGGTQLAERTRE